MKLSEDRGRCEPEHEVDVRSVNQQVQITNYQNFFFASRPVPQTAEHQNTRQRFDYVLDHDSAVMPRIGGANVNLLPGGLRLEDHTDTM